MYNINAVKYEKNGCQFIKNVENAKDGAKSNKWI